MADVGPDDEDEPVPPLKPRRQSRAKHALSLRHEAMARFVTEERKREPRVRYSELNRRVMERFDVSRNTADRAIATGQEMVRVDFERFCQDAPRAIFDSYMEIMDECMRDRNWTAARRTLDSVRDMFGLRSAINVNVNLGGQLPADAYSPLSDMQLEALAMLDDAAPNVIDVPSVSQSVELAGVALDVLEPNQGDDDE